MQFLPVVQRELLVAATKPNYRRFRIWSAMFLAFSGIATLLSFGDLNRAGFNGKTVFILMSVGIGVVCWLSGVFLTADCVSREKRDGTLGLLFLTDLKGPDIVLGKLVSTSIVTFYLVLACVPILTLIVLMGGVSGGDILRVAITLLVVMIFSLSLGMLISTFGHRAGQSGSVTFMVLVAITFIPVALNTLMGGRSTALELFTLISPLMLLGNAFSTENEMFTGGVVVLLLLTGVNLSISSFSIRYVWQQTGNDSAHKRARLRGRIPASKTSDFRPPQANKLLDHNPIEWLIGIPGSAPIVVPIVLGLAGGACLLLWPDPSRMIVVTLCTWVFPYVLALFIGSTANALFLDLRRNDAIEMLYSTPLTDQEIVDGQWTAIRKRYLVSALTIILFLWFPLDTMEKPVIGEEYIGQSWVSYFGWKAYITFRCIMLWLAAGWAGIYFALRTTRIHFVRLQTILCGTMLPWVVFCIPEPFITITLYGMFKSSVERHVRTTLLDGFQKSSREDTIVE